MRSLLALAIAIALCASTAQAGNWRRSGQKQIGLGKRKFSGV
jgi:hypothetical protein